MSDSRVAGTATGVDPEDDKKNKKLWARVFSFENLSSPNLWIFIVALAVILLLGWFFGNRVFSEITQAKFWFQREVPFSILVYYVVFCLCALVLIPYGPFCIAIGFIFGLWWGLLIQMIAVLLSAALLFFIGRYAFKDKVEEVIYKSEGSNVWKGLMRYIAKDWKEAAKINIILCFMPIPYGSHPYLFSLSSVPFDQFVLVFMLGMIPNTILNLLIGQALAEATNPEGINTYQIAGTCLAIIGCVAAVWYASTIAQEVYEEAEAAEANEKDRLIP